MRPGSFGRARRSLSGAALALTIVLGATLPHAGYTQEGVAGTIAAVGARDGRAVLDAIVTEALRHNLGLEQERLLVSRAETEVRRARGGYLPSLSLTGRYSEQSGAVDLGDFVNPVYATLNQLTGTGSFPTDLSVTVPFAYESRARLVQPLFNERIRAGHAAARAGHESQRASSNAFARGLAADAQTAFLRVGAARSATATWAAAVELVLEAERVAQRLVDAGTATPDAVFRARAERSDIEQRLLEAREVEAAASRAFNRLLDRPLDEPVATLPDGALLFGIDLTEEEALAAAREGRDELAALDAGIGVADAGVRGATAAFLPDVAVALDYGFQGNEVTFGRDRDFWMASLIVSWNLFNGGQDAARRSAGQADARRLRLAREEAEDLIRLEVRQAYRLAVVARDAIDTADARLAAARRTFELVRRRYEEGLATSIDFLDARTTLTGAELNRVVTAHTYAIRWVELERAAALRSVSALEASR
ncbi:MAG TPA: TolC family protein [Longimicrobiales bacterium]|nr:TolC family protein [Longimicrobiales bacterium]